jgi:hypothetical protein
LKSKSLVISQGFFFTLQPMTNIFTTRQQTIKWIVAFTFLFSAALPALAQSPSDSLSVIRLRDSLNKMAHLYNLREQQMIIQEQQIILREQQIRDLSAELKSKEKNLEEQLRIQREKEILFQEKENHYKDAINSTILDKVKLEGQISSLDSRLDGKEREINYLQKNINDKDMDIVSRNNEIQKIISDKARAEYRLDTVRLMLTETEKQLIKTSEQLKYTELKIKDCESRYISVTNKKKKTRVVQGFAIKNYRTPDFILAPKDVNNPSVLVINNRNSSNVEFDYVTGASFMVKDLSKPKAALTYDVGFFLGFGGNNLFKNFYIGPNVKLFDVVHINMGANIAEYEVLKDGFNIGDVLVSGTSIPTNKAWKINGYLGFTFDLELITMIGKR